MPHPGLRANGYIIGCLAWMDSLRLFVGWLAKSKVIRPGLLGLELRSCLAQSLHLLFSWLLTQENQNNDFNNNP
jgi:hypothetical protein